MPLETGGVLMGYWGSANEAVITAVIGPGPKAMHKKRSFRPDSAYHEQEIARLYAESGRTETYLGDWHTHPGAAAYMSFRDEETLNTIANYQEARLQRPLMMILGTDPFALRAWTRSPKKGFFSLRSAFTRCTVLAY